MRLHCYLAGVFVGYLMVPMQANQFQLNQTFVRSYWSIAAIVFVFSLFAGYSKDVSPVEFAVSLSIGRLLMSLFWGSLVVMCFLGHGGWLQRFLCCSTLAHLNKVSYLVYLLNPVIVTLFCAFQQGVNHYELTTTVSVSLAIITKIFVQTFDFSL